MSAPEYLTINELPVGTTGLYEFSFAGGYLEQAHVKLDFVTEVGARVNYPLTPDMFVSEFTLQIPFGDVPEGTASVRIYRDTPRSEPLINFTNGARITERNLDRLAQQTIFVAAEAFDAGAFAVAEDLIGQALTAIQDAQDALAAAGGIEASATASAAAALASQTAAATSAALALTRANAALASQDAAALSAAAALASQNAAASSATAASGSASAAATSATNAASSASAASGSATAASNSASAASGSATAAASSATAAAGSATTASTEAANANTAATAAANSAAAAAASATAAQVRNKIEPISASVAGNALTLTLNPTTLDFRSATLGSGAVNTRTVPSPITLTVSSGSTLGTTNGALARIAVLALDNAGTVELAAVNLAGGVNLDESGVISTTAEGGAGAADSNNVVYSTTARTNVPYRLLGFIESTQTTAGTWATAPSLVQAANPLAKWLSGYGQTWQNVLASRAHATTYTNTTGRPIKVSAQLVQTAGANVGATSTIGGTTGPTGSATYASGAYSAISFEVPAGATYSISIAGFSSLPTWVELR